MTKTGMELMIESAPTRAEHLLVLLRDENAELKALLERALEKIEAYHAHVKGEYVGGMPNQVLLPAIRKHLKR